MKKDTSDKIIDLNNMLNETEQQTIITESQQPVEVVTEQPVERDWDAIVAEWFYRLPKGFAEQPYTESELKVLDEVVSEYDTGGFKTVINEAMSKANKIKNEAELAIGYMFRQISGTGISSTAVKQMVDRLQQMPPEDVITLKTQHFRKYTLKQFIDGAYEYFKDFFPDKGTAVGTGRGELMAVMAIKGSSSGGTGEKDLKLANGDVWEVKEGPESIRMAKSGFAGLFGYIEEIKQFYKYLEILGVDDKSKDKNLLKNLKLAFNDDTLAEKIYNILVTNFRGDNFNSKPSAAEQAEEDFTPINAKDFFNRIKIAAELPAGAMELHYEGFEALGAAKSKLLKNSDLLKNAKMLVKTKDGDSEYWITTADAERMKNADVDTKVTIKKGAPASSKDLKVFMFNLINIFNHPYVKDPKKISSSFTERKNVYFSEDNMKGILWYLKNNPKPNLGYADDFIVYGISQNMGKMGRREKFKQYKWIAEQ